MVTCEVDGDSGCLFSSAPVEYPGERTGAAYLLGRYAPVWDGTNELAAVGVLGPRSTKMLQSWKDLESIKGARPQLEP